VIIDLLGSLDDSKLRVRVISQENEICKEYLDMLDKAGLEYEYYDGDNPLHKEELDSWGIQSFPVVQIISKENSRHIPTDAHGRELELIEHQFVSGWDLTVQSIETKIYEIEHGDESWNFTNYDPIYTCTWNIECTSTNQPPFIFSINSCYISNDTFKFD